MDCTPISAAPTRPCWLRLAPRVPMLLGMLALAACSSLPTPFSGGGRSEGGLPATQAARVSLVVAQTRAQFPKLSGTDIPYEPRKAPEDAAAHEPELALRGAGVGVEPGLQTGERPHIQAALYLDKTSYARGYLEVTPGGGKAERWPIVAFDEKGAPRKTFDFTYVLATPAGQLRYLSLIGGSYQKDGEDYLGYEGTLIEPGPGNDLEHWARAYKLDFGYRWPVVPSHEKKVDQAVTLFRTLQGDMEHLRRLRRNIAEAEAELATLRNNPVPAEQKAAQDQRIAKEEQLLETQRSERDATVEATEAHFVSYYGLRREIADEFDAFTQSNRYTWLDQAGKQEFWDRWKVVEFHHPKIDDLVSAFLAFKEHGGKVLDARSTAMVEITAKDNWAKDPSRSGKATPRQ